MAITWRRFIGKIFRGKCSFTCLTIALFIYAASKFFFSYSHSNTMFKEVVEPNMLPVAIRNNTIKLVSYNLCCNYISQCPCKTGCQERLSGFITGITNYDILLLQEIFVLQLGPFFLSDNARFLIQESEKEQFSYRNSFLASLKNLFFAQNNGLASLSKFPVRSSKSVAFECSSIWEYPTIKGYSMLEIPVKTSHITDKSLFLFNAHLDAHKVETRTCQLRELQSQVMKLPAGSYIVISGDLNVDPLKGDLREYQALQRIMEYVGLLEVYNKNDVTYIDGSHFDHTFISKNIKVLTSDIRNLFANSEPVSDHSGLFMILKFLE